jgi:hypothetical protein
MAAATRRTVTASATTTAARRARATSTRKGYRDGYAAGYRHGSADGYVAGYAAGSCASRTGTYLLAHPLTRRRPDGRAGSGRRGRGRVLRADQEASAALEAAGQAATLAATRLPYTPSRQRRGTLGPHTHLWCSQPMARARPRPGGLARRRLAIEKAVKNVVTTSWRRLLLATRCAVSRVVSQLPLPR